MGISGNPARVQSECREFSGAGPGLLVRERPKSDDPGDAGQSRRINEIDPSIPVIMIDNGRLMDGRHQLARTQLEGRKTVKAVRFEEMPESDGIVEL